VDLKNAIFQLKIAALQKAAAKYRFGASEADAIFALRNNPQLERAFDILVQREPPIVRANYAIRHAFRRVTAWYRE